MLLHLLPQLDEECWTLAVKKLREWDQVEGPRACAWLFNGLARQVKPGKDRIYLRNQADILAQEAVGMRRIRKGWQQFGVDDPWWVVHEPRREWIPRYHSEPALKTLAET